MIQRSRYALMLVATATATACASSGRQAPPASRYGVFQFYERVAETNPAVVIEGTLTVLPDTIIVDATPGPCGYRSSSRTGIWYRCGDVTLYFDRANPVQRNSYSAPTTVLVTQTSCAEYGTAADGRSRCIRQETQQFERSSSRGGRLRPRRVS